MNTLECCGKALVGNVLPENAVSGSMSKPGCPYANSPMESFFASLKKEFFSERSMIQ